MKRVILLLHILGIFFLSTSCDELFRFLDDPGGNTSTDSTAIRIKRINYFNNDTADLSGREEYMYDDYNKVNLILFSADMFGNDSLVDHGQSIFNYDGTTITQIYSMEGKEESKTIYTMDGEKLMKSEELYIDATGQWFTESIIEYSYEGDLLKREVYSDNDGTTMKVSGERNFTYENGLMSDLQYSGDWGYDTTDDLVMTNEQMMYYSNGKLDSIHYSYKVADGSFLLSAREFFTYVNDLLSERRYVVYNQTTLKWAESYTHKYSYDSDGLLKEIVRQYTGGSPTKTTYEWEKEKGNVGSFYGIQYYRYMGLQIVD